MKAKKLIQKFLNGEEVSREELVLTVREDSNLSLPESLLFYKILKKLEEDK